MAVLAPTATGCLGDDILLELVEHRLDAEALRQIDAHMATCADCRKLVAEATSYYSPAESASGLAGSDDANEPTIVRPQGEASLLPLENGRIVGRYAIVQPIGRGGMGMVYKAHDPQLNRSIALKLLRPDKLRAGDSAHPSQTRLLREAQAMARVSHPNVVTVYDAGTFEGQVFVAMELVRGQTLKNWLAAELRSRDQILDVFLHAGAGLAAAHEAGLVHRDFKPDNVLIGANGRVRVSDFGLARPIVLSVEERQRFTPVTMADHPALTTLTGTGVLVGTPAYMAPEQCSGEAADARSDQFSFCVALYEALYRERPFAGEDFESLAAELLNGRVREAPEGADVPAWLRAVLLRGLRVAPHQRHPSVSALLDALIAGRGATPARKPPTRRFRLLVGVGGVLVAAALVMSVRWRATPLPQAPSTPAPAHTAPSTAVAVEPTPVLASPPEPAAIAAPPPKAKSIDTIRQSKRSHHAAMHRPAAAPAPTDNRGLKPFDGK